MSVALELEAVRNDGLSLVQIAQNLQLTRWMNAVAISLLIYDTSLIFGDEVQLFWPKRWSVIKLFYYLNRALCAVFTLINAQQFISSRTMSDRFCTYSLIGVGYATFLSFAMCNWMLLARTRALLGHSRPTFNTLLVIYFFLSYAITGVLVAITSHEFRTKIFFSPTMHICSSSIHPKTMGFIWVPPMLFEATIFVVTTIKLYDKTRHSGGFGTYLFSILFRDGVCYYVSILLFRTWNLVAWNMRPISFTFTGVFILWVIMSIACSRLQLNLLRAANYQSETCGTGGVISGGASNTRSRDVPIFGRRASGSRWLQRPRNPRLTLDDASEKKQSILNTVFQQSVSAVRSLGKRTKPQDVEITVLTEVVLQRDDLGVNARRYS